MPFDPENVLPPGAKIKVIGVGGGGGNAVNTMIRSGLEGVEFVTANTDVQSLCFSLAQHKVQIGKELTRGLGAGADPDVGREAAMEDRHELQELLAGADMVFVTAGMGGGTGTGGASVVAQIARELGALTVAVVTKPFSFEGKRRRKHADIGIARLRECVDALITIPNQRLLQVATPGLSMIDAFKMADEVLVNAVRGISDIINIPGLVNADFADVKTIMSCMGQALMGIGHGRGEKRAVDAARQAISSPLLEDIDIEGATGILINITAGSEVTLMEVNEACEVVQEAAHEDANIIFGAVIDEALGDEIRVTVVATGFPVDKDESEASGSGKLQPAPILSRLTTPVLTAPRPAARPAEPQATAPALSGYGEPVSVPETASQVESPTTGVSEPAVPVAEQPSIPAGLQPEPAVFTAAPQAPSPQLAAAPELSLAATASDETQELARWTLDSPYDGNGFADDIPSLAPETPVLFAASPTETLFGAPHVEGASAGEHEPSVAEVLFAAGFADASSLAPDEDFLVAAADSHTAPIALTGAEDARPGAGKEHAPLEPFFEEPAAFLTSDIDRKIDEALELAERMRAPRKATDIDDLDVPAFLRNGMKDLPLD